MKIRYGLSLVAGACALFLSTVSLSASGWTIAPLKGHAAVGTDSAVHVLGTTWSSQGWRLQTYDFTYPGAGVQWEGTRSGTSIALSTINNAVWLAQANGDVSDGTHTLSGGACEGGYMLVRQEPGHNNLAVVGNGGFAPWTGFVTIIDLNGRVRTWNGTNCWTLLPALPSGAKANDMSLLVKPTATTTASSTVWVTDVNGLAFYWNGGTWASIFGNGIVKGVSFNEVVDNNDYRANGIGMDNMSLWNWSTAGWTQTQSLNVWDHWQILQVGSSVSRTANVGTRAITGVVVGLDETVWVNGPV
jgi:hypothetical protein